MTECEENMFRSQVGDIRRCILTLQELQETPLVDEFAVARMLVAKGFKAEGGPIQPKLSGIIECTLDVKTGNYCYAQYGA